MIKVPENYRAQFYRLKLNKFCEQIREVLSNNFFEANFLNETIAHLATNIACQIDSLILPQVVQNIHDNQSRLQGGTSTERYQSYFVQNGQPTNWFKTFWVTNAWLESKVNSFIDSQVDFIQEIVSNYQKDTNEGLPNFGRIVDIKFSGSDLHNGGKQVVKVYFENGSLMYKSRSLKPDLLVYDFIDFLDLKEIGIDLLMPITYDFGDHGWQEMVIPKNCENELEINNFWHRAGAWLAILDVLNYHDGHFENIAVTQGYPVPIDLETVFNSFGEISLNEELGERSILFTGLVQKVPERDTHMGYTAGFQTPPVGRVHLLEAGAINEGTDQISLQYQWLDNSSNDCCPTIHGNPVMIHEYVADFIKGYKETAFYIHNRRDFLLNQEVWWKKLDNCYVRQVIRPTIFYQSLLCKVLVPGFNIDLPKELFYEGYEDVIEYEVQQIESLNIPYFVHSAGNKELITGDGEKLVSQCSGVARDEIKDNLSRGEVYIARQVVILQNILPHTPYPGEHKVQ